MKKLIFLFLVYFIVVQANPRMMFYLNELKVDPNDPYNWELEIKNMSLNTLKECYLTTNSDTVYLNDMFILIDEVETDEGMSLLVVKEKTSYLNKLFINPDGDLLTLHNSYGFMDEICFGNYEHEYYDISIPAPKQGQSICLNEYEYYDGNLPGDMQGYYYYLDNTPTIGSENDIEGVEDGYIDGYVVDDENNPLDSVEVNFGFNVIPLNTFTDSNGYFKFSGWWNNATTFRFHKKGYKSEYERLRILPITRRGIPILAIELAAVRRRSWGVKCSIPKISELRARARVGARSVMWSVRDGFGNKNSLSPVISLSRSICSNAGAESGTR